MRTPVPVRNADLVRILKYNCSEKLTEPLNKVRENAEGDLAATKRTNGDRELETKLESKFEALLLL